MADKEKETKAVAPWRPFMDLTRWERRRRVRDAELQQPARADQCRNGIGRRGLRCV